MSKEIPKELKKGFRQNFMTLGENATKEIVKNFKAIEEHCIQIQENQVEFEKYLKDLKSKIDKIDKRTKRGHGE